MNRSLPTNWDTVWCNRSKYAVARPRYRQSRLCDGPQPLDIRAISNISLANNIYELNEVFLVDSGWPTAYKSK